MSTPNKDLSWVEICEQEDSPTAVEKSKEKLFVLESHRQPKTASNSSKMYDNIKESIRKERKLEIEIFEEQNERKFDRMVKEEKLKSPFKRRLSTQSDKSENSINGELDNKRTKTDVPDKNRPRCESLSSNGSGNSKPKREVEKDVATLCRRQKQIDFGKNTIGYDNYLRQIPKESRMREHPKTPDKNIIYSRRAWDGLIKLWRKELHFYDEQGGKSAEESAEMDETAEDQEEEASSRSSD